MSRYIHCDMAVIGGGGSGLAAAVRACESGAGKVVVVEKLGRPGGNTMLALGMMGANTVTQKRYGMDVSPEKIFKLSMDGANWSVDPKLIKKFVKNTETLVSWLEAKGLEFKVSPAFMDFGIGGVYHEMPEKKSENKEPWPGPGFVGSCVVETLLEECKKWDIEILTRTKATKIMTDASGNIAGVMAESDTDEIEISAKGVIISAGGFGANKAMMKKYFPEFFTLDKDISRLCLGTTMGEGIQLAEEAGAKTGEHMGVLLFGTGHHPGAFSLNHLLPKPYMLCVNRCGERFYDESIARRSQYAMSKEPNTKVFGIMDEDTKNHFINEIKTDQWLKQNSEYLLKVEDDLKQEDAEGKLSKIAGSIGELAAFIGADPAALKKTIEAYNDYCDKGCDEDFFKDKSFLRPVRKAPFYAVVGFRCIDSTQGGISINDKLEVLGKNGEVINGLYATGDNCSGWVTQNYSVPGSSLAWCFNSGYMAGENAAAYVNVLKRS
ncbi:MAG: FAD-binding protein [Clostridiales bacterium]|nr:FAD-binding protein [Clostridiales bacterium]